MEPGPPDDASLPPAGHRTGLGSNSILQFLKNALAARPSAPSLPDYLDTPAPTAPGDLHDAG